jgi:putative sporulation protein YtxC
VDVIETIVVLLNKEDEGLSNAIQDYMNNRNNMEEYKIVFIEKCGKTEFEGNICEYKRNSHKNNPFYLDLSKVIAKYIIVNYEEKVLKKIIYRHFAVSDENDIHEIIKRCKDSIKRKNKESDSFYRANYIEVEVYNYLLDSNVFDLQGIINFRLKEYVNILKNIVEECIDNYFEQKEFDELLSLLKHYVESQKPKYDTLNIIFIDNGEYMLIDSLDNNVTTDCAREFMEILSDYDFRNDDVLMSSIIYAAPKKLVMHNIHDFHNNELINTIASIFSGRIVICSDCCMCKNVKCEEINLLRQEWKLKRKLEKQ